MDCPEPRRLLDLAEDRILPAEAEALSAHLSDCPSCASKARAAEQAFLQGAGRGTGMPWWILPLALSLLALAGFFLLARRFGR